MCVVSMVMDHYSDKWGNYFPPQPPSVPFTVTIPMVTQEEIDEFRRLLERAREYDKKHNEPDCEIAEKRQKVKQLADMLGVKVDFL